MADICQTYREWCAKGAQFVTEPRDCGAEIRCYLSDPDGYYIELGQEVAAFSELPAGCRLWLASPRLPDLCVEIGNLDAPFGRIAELPRGRGNRPAIAHCQEFGAGSTTIRNENMSMTKRDEYESLYLSYLKHCNEHDLDGMASFYTTPMKVNDVPMDPASVTAQFVPLISAFPDWHWDMRHLVVDGDYLALHFTVTGTHRGAFQGIEATGRRVSVSEFTLYHVVDGKFAEVWDLTDLDAVIKQIS